MNRLKLTFYNVVLIPAKYQKSQRYEDLFKKIFIDKLSYATYGEKNTRIFSLKEADDLLYGNLINYTKLENNEWFNSENGEVEEFEFNKNMHPNVKLWDYFFSPKYHTLAVVSNASVSQIERFFKFAFSKVVDDSIGEEVAFNVIGSNESIDRILSLKSMTSIKVSLHYSNNDSEEDWDELIDNSMKESDVRNAHLELSGTRKNPIKTEKNPFLASFIKLSRRNGKVIAVTQEHGQRKVLSNSDIPAQRILEYDNEQNLLIDVKSTLSTKI